jgi:hypothetical protein
LVDSDSSPSAHLTTLHPEILTPPAVGYHLWNADMADRLCHRHALRLRHAHLLQLRDNLLRLAGACLPALFLRLLGTAAHRSRWGSSGLDPTSIIPVAHSGLTVIQAVRPSTGEAGWNWSATTAIHSNQGARQGWRAGDSALDRAWVKTIASPSRRP